MADLKQLYDAILNGDAKTAHGITEQALKNGADPVKLVTERAGASTAVEELEVKKSA